MTAQIPIGGRLTGLFRGAQLRARSLRATVLVMGGFGAQKAIQLGSNLVLTRILFPEAFGLMALITVFLTGLSLISDVGIQASLVRSQRSDGPDFQATAWTLQVVRGLWITALAWLLAWPYSLIYDEPQLFPLICLSSVSAAVAGFKSVQMAMQQRQLILGRVVILQVASQVVSISFTILLAWWMHSVWGLAIGTVVAAVVQTGLSHVILPSPNHRLRWHRDVLAEIVRFGRWILLATLFTFLGGKGIQAIQGYLTDLETLAFLHIASMFAMLLAEMTLRLLGSVGYSALSEVARNRPHDLRRVAARIRTLQTAVTTPGYILLAVVAQPLIGVLYDDRYAAAGLYLSFLALNGAISVLPMIYQNALLASGDSRAHAFVMGVASALKIAATVAGFYIGGPVGMIVGVGVAEVLVFVVSVMIASRRGFATLSIDVLNLGVVLVAYAGALLILL